MMRIILAIGSGGMLFLGLLTFLFNPIIGGIFGVLGLLAGIAAMMIGGEEEKRFTCPHCHNYLLAEATMCPTCHGAVTPQSQKRAPRYHEPKTDPVGANK